MSYNYVIRRNYRVFWVIEIYFGGITECLERETTCVSVCDWFTGRPFKDSNFVRDNLSEYSILSIAKEIFVILYCLIYDFCFIS